MRILFFTENNRCGGLDTFLITLINNWPSASDELILTCNRSHPGLSIIEKKLSRQCKIIKHNIPVISDIIPKKHYLNQLFSFLFHYLLFGYYFISLKSVLFRDKPDRLMVISGGYPGGDTCRAAVIVWGALAKKPLAVYNFHNFAVAPKWYKKPVEYMIDWLVGHFSKQVVTVSNATIQSLKQRPVIANMKKASFIYNGITISNNLNSSSNICSLKKELQLSSDSKICLMMGTYEKRKGHRFLLAAFRKVIEKNQTVHLVICGSGFPHEIKVVNDIIKEFRLEKYVHTFEFRDDVSYLLKDTDVLLVPSQEFESFGLICIEAMAHKIPVVCTSVGGLPEVVVDGEGGYCHHPNDINGYASRIAILLEDEILRREQGEKGFQRYKKLFTGKRMAEEYANLICQ